MFNKGLWANAFRIAKVWAVSLLTTRFAPSRLGNCIEIARLIGRFNNFAKAGFIWYLIIGCITN